jgi:phosphopantothenoylcysteine decarboxylase/phosphopantothenate--cysteine ligase
MGFAIAGELASRGAHVILVCGPVSLQLEHPLLTRIDVTTADEMYDACISNFPSCDGAIMTAAVADYAPVSASREKIKRSGGNRLLELRPNKDIAAELGRLKNKNQFLVGFALETNDEIENASSKLKMKNLDMIVLNSLREEGAGFGFDTNKVSILTRKGQVFDYSLKSKKEVAVDIVDRMLELSC